MGFPAEPFSTSKSRRRFLTRTSLAAAAGWASRAEGRVPAPQVMVARIDRKPGPAEASSMDQWPGYE